MIENMLASDFAKLVRQFDADEFTGRILKKLNGAERLRLVAIGGAGALGAGVAATQFGAIASAIRDMLPAAANIAVADAAATVDLGAAPLFMTAALFALLGGATAFVFAGSR